MAIGSQAHKLILDTREFASGAIIGRRELRLLRTSLAETATDTQKFAAATDVASRALAANDITLEEHRRILDKANEERADVQQGRAFDKEFMPAGDQARQKMAELKASFESGNVSLAAYENGMRTLNAEQLRGIPIVGNLLADIASMSPAGIAAAAGTAVLTAGVVAVGAAVAITTKNIRDQIDKIDKLIEASETISIPIAHMQRLSHATQRAGITQEAFGSGTEKMLVNISKGADGSKKLAAEFNQLGLDAAKLRSMKTEDSFDAITRAISKLPAVADRARSATAIFGSADFMRVDVKNLDHAGTLIDELRGGLTEVDKVSFKRMDDSVKDMNLSLDVTWQKITMAVVPAIGDFADMATEALVNINQSETFTSTLDEITIKLQSAIAVASEMPGVIDKWNKSFTGAVVSEMAGTSRMMDVLGGMTGIGGVVSLGSALLDPVGEQAKRGRELDAELSARKESPAARIDEERTKAIDSETEAIEKLLDKLKEEVATRGMSAAAAKVWKLEQLEASEPVLTAARELAIEYDRMEKAKKSQEAIENFTESLRHQGESAEQSARRMAELKLEHAGVEAEVRKGLMAQFDISEAQKKAAAEATANANAQKGYAEDLARQEAKLRGYTSAVGDHEERIRAGERATLQYNLALKGTGDAATQAALKSFDAITALEKQQKATHAAQTATEKFEKELRQLGMSAQAKQRDELRQQGVSEEEIKKIKLLQDELHLRELVLAATKAQLSMRDAVRGGSREAFDIVENNLRRAQAAEQWAGTLNPSPLAKPGESIPEERLRVQLRRDSQRDPFADSDIRARLMTQRNEKIFSDIEARDQLLKRVGQQRTLNSQSNIDARADLSLRMNQASQPGDRKQDKANELLAKISQNTADSVLIVEVH